MVTDFEDYTSELTQFEREILVPRIAGGLKYAVGRECAVTNKRIRETLRREGYGKNYPKGEIPETTIRACIHHIRVHDLVPMLLAGSKGYYIARELVEAERYFASLKERENSIKEVREALGRQMTGRLF